MKRPVSRTVLVLLACFALWPAPAPAAGGDLETVVFEVRGLWAELCDWYVEEALLEGIAGLVRVDADHEADIVTIVFDPSEQSPEELAARIQDCPFLSVTGSATHELDRDEIRRHARCWCCSWIARAVRG